ncbi:MAG: V-type ATP synthase subunit K [Firmicutes bacterium]|jgi:V/A-type H+-transporting ATPase subunit K|nr:V-type ATP synthase subunit K [Bacillota bacterium]
MSITIGMILGFFAVALAFILPGVGSAIGTALVGSAGSGVVTEDPDKFGQVLLLQVLPGTQGIYGALTGFLLMMKMGVFAGDVIQLTTTEGWLAIAAATPIALVGLISAVIQGKVAAAGLGVIAKRPEELGKPLVFAAMVETYAVLAFLATLLLVLFGIDFGGVA